MNNSQFKFKPDKIKYLSNIDTLDSIHKTKIDFINKKREDFPKKQKRFVKLQNDLVEFDKKTDIDDYISIRSKLIDEINNLEEEINLIENYDEEIEYYFKTHQILFNYYDITDGQNPKEFQEKIVEEFNDNININIEENNSKWNFDGIDIFDNKSNKLDLLNELSKKKRKEKKVTKRRVKNIESLINNNNNNIFDYIDGNKTNNNNTVQDRATLYEDYKIVLEGYTNKKKINRPCLNCKIDKVLIYSEGIYVCMNCGEVENCIIESEITNYKDPMVEKPTFPYKRKNHFCEWTVFNCSSKLISKGLANVKIMRY
jgi:hypothetical protein